MRTLIIGIPLPNALFDNHSFVSAPSFGDYQRIIVDLAAVSRTVDEVVHRTAAHTTYGGQAVVNGDASPHAFSLRELVMMRGREADWLLSHGGLVGLIGYPDVVHADIAGGPWHSYDWLPEPDSFSFQRDLLAGFGRPGAVLVDEEHPFAPFVQALASRLAYRVYVNEEAPGLAENGHVFARSEGGIPIAFDIRAGEGHIVVLPPITRPESDRLVIATALTDSFERWDARGAAPPRGLSRAEEATKEVT